VSVSCVSCFVSFCCEWEGCQTSAPPPASSSAWVHLPFLSHSSIIGNLEIFRREICADKICSVKSADVKRGEIYLKVLTPWASPTIQ